jgi:hypothetical protein
MIMPPGAYASLYLPINFLNAKTSALDVANYKAMTLRQLSCQKSQSIPSFSLSLGASLHLEALATVRFQ